MSQPVPSFIVTPDAAGVISKADSRAIRQALKARAGKPTQIVLSDVKSQRSLDQNAWIWGVAYPVIAESIGYDAHEMDDLHYALVAKWGGEHFDKRLGAMVPNKRSSKLSTKEFSDYMEWLVRFAATELGGILVPLPGEDMRLAG